MTEQCWLGCYAIFADKTFWREIFCHCYELLSLKKYTNDLKGSYSLNVYLSVFEGLFSFGCNVSDDKHHSPPVHLYLKWTAAEAQQGDGGGLIILNWPHKCPR